MNFQGPFSDRPSCSAAAAQSLQKRLEATSGENIGHGVFASDSGYTASGLELIGLESLGRGGLSCFRVDDIGVFLHCGRSPLAADSSLEHRILPATVIPPLFPYEDMGVSIFLS